MHISLRGYATAVIGELTGDQIGGRVADDLTAVAHLVSRTSALAVVMTDFTVPVPARKAVLEDLLRSRVHPAALRLALRSVESERAEELTTSLHELYELALHLHVLGPAELLAEEPIATRGGWRNFASGYASAVFEEVAETSELEEIEDEIFRFARIVESQPSLRSAVSDHTRPIEDRERLVNGLLEGKVRPATLRIVKIPLQGRVPRRRRRARLARRTDGVCARMARGASTHGPSCRRHRARGPRRCHAVDHRSPRGAPHI